MYNTKSCRHFCKFEYIREGWGGTYSIIDSHDVAATSIQPLQEPKKAFISKNMVKKHGVGQSRLETSRRPCRPKLLVDFSMYNTCRHFCKFEYILDIREGGVEGTVL